MQATPFENWPIKLESLWPRAVACICLLFWENQKFSSLTPANGKVSSLCTTILKNCAGDASISTDIQIQDKTKQEKLLFLFLETIFFSCSATLAKAKLPKTRKSQALQNIFYSWHRCDKTACLRCVARWSPLRWMAHFVWKATLKHKSSSPWELQSIFWLLVLHLKKLPLLSGRGCPSGSSFCMDLELSLSFPKCFPLDGSLKAWSISKSNENINWQFLCTLLYRSLITGKTELKLLITLNSIPFS